MENKKAGGVKRPTAPGLGWYGDVPRWRASAKARAKGFEPPTVNLSKYRDDPDQLRYQCEKYQREQDIFLNGAPDAGFDKTLGSLLKKYQTDPDSPYHNLRPSSRRPYDHYIKRLIPIIGDRKIAKITGMDLKRWHDAWSDGGRMLASSKMQRAILDAAISYGIMCRLKGCLELREVLKTASRKLPHPRRREFTVTAEQVVSLRKAAHEAKRPACALAYALVFETTLRLWDVIGQWVKTEEYGISDITNAGKKWFGLRWEDINGDLVLHYVPSKTSMKTGLAVTFPLRMAPMVMEELEHWPQEGRQGPVIVNATTGLPYSAIRFDELWRRDRKAACISDKVWARDLRASGITEGRAAGALTDDVAKVAGHSSTRTTSEIYDRAALEAAERFAEARVEKRKKNA